MSERRPDDPAALVPHRGPARFVTDVVDSGEGTIVCRGEIPTHSPYVRAGTLPTFVLLELAAQGAALLEALEGIRRDGVARPKQGYIVRARRLVFTEPRVASDAVFTVRVRREGKAAGLHLYEAEVEALSKIVFRGTFGTFVESGPFTSIAP